MVFGVEDEYTYWSYNCTEEAYNSLTWDVDDIMIVKLSCNDWEVSFYINMDQS